MLKGCVAICKKLIGNHISVRVSKVIPGFVLGFRILGLLRLVKIPLLAVSHGGFT